MAEARVLVTAVMGPAVPADDQEQAMADLSVVYTLGRYREDM